MDTAYGELVSRVRSARRSSGQVLLEGVHALKHASRFGADIELVVTPDRRLFSALLADLAPDVAVPTDLIEVDRYTWARLTNDRALPSPSLAVAARPHTVAQDVLAADGRVVVLEAPRHLGNLGAVIRVSAAANAAGVVVIGDADPWHPTAVRGAAGLQFAVQVARADALPATTRPILAVDADGDPDLPVPDDAVLLLGTERGGLTSKLRSRAHGQVAIAMREGVSSLNMATAAAVILFTR